MSLTAPFTADDFLFLDKTRDASFSSLWKLSALSFSYYRPWSRELHYWLIQHVFGSIELPFHIASLLVWCAAMFMYRLFVQRLSGSSVAAIATCAVAALASWPILLVWIAGSQDLWMLGFVMAALVALSYGRKDLSIGFYVGALLSKETAAVFPVVALAYYVIVVDARWTQSLKATIGLWTVTFIWALIHPQLGGRVWGARQPPPLPGLHESIGHILVRTPLTAINLDLWPQPDRRWVSAIPVSAFAATVVLPALLGFVLARTRHQEAPPPLASGRRGVLFGAVLGVIGWAPLLAPSIGWHGYYGLLGCMGAWIAIGHVLASRVRLAIAAVALLALIGTARLATVSKDWGTGWYQIRAADFVRGTRAYFLTMHPTLPPNSRVYLAGVPGGVGMLPGGERSPILAYWYRDTTIQTWFVSRYRRRAAGELPGTDFFFTYDNRDGWTEDGTVTSSAQPTQEERLAQADELWKLRRFADAAYEYRRLSEQYPDRFDYVFNVGSCYFKMGDSAEAARWYKRAASFSDAPREMRDAARRMERFLK